MDPLETGKLLIMLAGIAGLYLKLNQAVRTMNGKGEAREISNNPLHVQKQSRPATLEDVKRLEARVVRLEDDVHGMKTDSAKAREKIHDELTEIRDRMDDKFTGLGDDLREIGRAVGRLEGS
jgi:hypothetical protein